MSADAAYAGTLPAPQAFTRELAFDIDSLFSLRRFLSAWASEELMESARTEELVLAVNELASNSIRYGGGSGRLVAWRYDDTLLCEVRDRGHITDLRLGRDCPDVRQPSGRGLWLVSHLCDLVQIRSSRDGTAVRVHKQLS